MRTSRAARALCALLAVCLVAGGCGQEDARETWAITSTVAPVPSLVFGEEGAYVAGEASPPADRPELVPFDQMQYYRPSLKGAVDRLGALAQAVLACKEEPGAAPVLLNDAARIWDNYATALNLAMIHNAIDTTDAYWQEEYAACLDMRGELATAMGAVLGAARSLSGETTQEEQKTMADSAVLSSLQAEESALMREYQNVLTTATVDVNGTPVPYSDNMDYAAYEQWVRTYAPQLGDIFVRLVRVRNQIARLFGYENYAEYQFADSGLSPLLISTLLSSMRLYLAPLLGAGADNPGVALDVPIENAIAMMRSVFPRIQDGLAHSLDVMESFQLSSLADSPQKAPGAFTGYIKEYEAPFICMRYDGSYQSFSTLLHEFGHFNELYMNESASMEDPETSEIFSTALVLLASNYYGEMFGPEAGEAARRYELKNLLLTLLSQGVYLAIEMEVYALPDEALTYEQICALASQAHADMGFPATDLDSVSWVQVMRLFDSPFYVMSYILSGDVAMQLWEISQTDPQMASQKYAELMTGAREEKDFLPNVLDSGLTSPFESSQIQHLADVFASQLGIQVAPAEPAAGA